jgi:hypothetical protein
LRHKAALHCTAARAYSRGDASAADIGRAVRRYEGLDAETQAEFDDGVVERRHHSEISELVDSGDMDGADLQRFSEMLDRRDRDPLVDGSIV